VGTLPDVRKWLRRAFRRSGGALRFWRRPALPTTPTTFASLIAPAKLATLGERGANPRIQKSVYWLATAQQQGQKPSKVLDHAVERAGYTNRLAAKLTKETLLRNVDIAEKLGCLDAEGMAEMKRGKAPTVRRGPYKGDQLSVDHIVPRAVVPELDNVIANLELLPERLNSQKKDKVGARQVDLARKLAKARLLSEKGLAAVERAARKGPW
jgi:5-methylcytosine-specific restriction endonuclease McrA